MSSSMLAGERRWASARRGGMTVLGKVAVPKPLNLPSQRLENHGLDPTLEIVPKGTLSWGSRSSSFTSTTNSQTSSTLSTKTGSSSGSPSNLSARPSSGGSGTRPSTSGSDRTHESAPNAWGPNSRPSSPSGALTSNQSALTSLRPHSAETRPGSSQLSRFADSVAWSSTSVSERLGVASFGNDGFSLSSGDFPTLGSERENTGKSIDSQDNESYVQPGSSSGRAAVAKERTLASPAGDISANANVKSGAVDSWRRDEHVEDEFKPSVEKWPKDLYPYPNANILHQHFDAWRGPPMNAHPHGVWYRGPPGGPPYGTPLAPGGFPIEPFPYFRPQIPATALANSQPAPPPGGGPIGHHPKNGELYRPHAPDTYICPGMPIRAGFFPGPVAYEGYYGPMGYSTPNEHNIPFIGRPPGPSVHNRFSGGDAPDLREDHAGAVAHGPSGKALASEYVEACHPNDTRGRYKVLQKQHNEWDGKEESGKWEQTVALDAFNVEKGDQLRELSHNNEWGEDKKNEETSSGGRAHPEDAAVRCIDIQKHNSSELFKAKFSESTNRAKGGDISLSSNSQNWASTSMQVTQVFPSTPDPSLIQKSEGLNVKAQVSDGQLDVPPISGREIQRNRLQVVNARVNHSQNESGSVAVSVGRTYAGKNLMHSLSEVDVPVKDMTPQMAVSSDGIPRRPSIGMQGRLDHDGKRFNAQSADGWRKRPLAAETATAVSVRNTETVTNINVHELHTSVEAIEKSRIDTKEKDEGESLTPMLYPGDCQDQRAKMREISRQRAKQLQKEEEERSREQKARALAKLEDLNRRTRSIDGLTQKGEKDPTTAVEQEKVESPILPEPVMVVGKSDTPTLSSNSTIVAANADGNSNGVRETNPVSSGLLAETQNITQQGIGVPCDQHLHDAQNAEAADCKAALQLIVGSASKHMCTGHKLKQNNAAGERSSAKSRTAQPTEVLDGHKTHIPANDVAPADVVAGEVGSSGESDLPANSNAVTEALVHQRRKNNRSGRNKQRREDVPSVVDLPATAPKENNSAKSSVESEKPKAFDIKSDPSSCRLQSLAKHASQPSEQLSSLPMEEVHGRVNNQWKSQQARRMSRNQQVNRMGEKFHANDTLVWAPVRSQNKAEVLDEASGKTVSDITPAAKSDTVVHNSLKCKRAEMERYVPKPVAKELAQQQGSIQPMTTCSVDQVASDEIVRRVDAGSRKVEGSEPDNAVTGNMGSTVELRNGDRRQNNQTKPHGSWHQRGSVESVNNKGLADGSSSLPNRGKNVPEARIRPSEDWDSRDNWSTPEKSDATAAVTSPMRDQGAMGRGKRHPLRGHKNMESNNNIDSRNFNHGDTDKSSMRPGQLEVGQTDKNNASSESCGVGEQTASHWQPKSQTYAGQNQHTRKSNEQTASAEGSNNALSTYGSEVNTHLPSQKNEERVENRVQHPVDQSSKHKDVAEASKASYQGAKKERKVASSKGRSYSPHENSVDITDSASGSIIAEHKNGNQNGRSTRGYESRGGHYLSGKDNRQNNPHTNRVKQRPNSHYEYQPIGQNNDSTLNNIEGSAGGSLNTGAKYSQRSQSHSRRGGSNQYNAQSGRAQVDVGYD